MSMDTLTGKSIKSYELHEIIGTGAFGAVYRAHQTVVERDVAIKIIWPVFASLPMFIRQFETEAQLVAGLEHPYIVPVYDYWRDPEGAYIVMRWLRGGHLGDVLSRGQMRVAETVRLVEQIGGALSLAHQAGVVHCDLKPENILMDEAGNTYLSDFGIARMLNRVRDTSIDFISSAGSPAYAAPEQLFGDAPTPQTDMYSLGIILFECLTGAHPFPYLTEMSASEVRAVRLVKRIPPLSRLRPDLPHALDEVLQYATAIDPAHRFRTIESMAEAFQTAAKNNGHSIQSSRLVSPSDVVLNPYKGLRAFQEVDAPYFFGREALVQRLVERLDNADTTFRFLALVGPSGSGKSSLVKAGLIPALRRDAIPGSKEWFIVEMVPGEAPFEALEAALNRVAIRSLSNLQALVETKQCRLLDILAWIWPDDPDAELLLFIDQFEEIFSLPASEETNNLFLQMLQEAIIDPNSRVRMIVTLRADFYDRPLLHPALSALMRERTEVIVPLSVAELEQTIVQPAARVGVVIDPGVVASIMIDLSEQPGALPLLQYSLSELFEHRQNSVITAKVYREIGGVLGALTSRAESLFRELPANQQEITRQLFMRLITLGEGAEDTRRRVLLHEIMGITSDSGAVRSVIDKLATARLLTLDRDMATRTPTVEIAHEAIIREWERLHTWVDNSRHNIRMQRTLARLAQEWVDNNNESSFLLAGSRLAQMEHWLHDLDIALTPAERQYLEASLREQQQRQTEEKARAQHERQLERQAFNRLRLLVGVLLAAILVATVLATIARGESQNSREERNRAESARATSDANAAQSRSLAQSASANEAISQDNADLAVVLALAANEMEAPPVKSLQTLAEIAFAPGTRYLLTGHTSQVTAADFSPDNRYLVSASRDTTIRLWDLTTGQEIRRFSGHKGDVEAVTFSPDGLTILSGAADFTAILWDAASGEQIRQFTGHRAPLRSVTFSPDGTLIATADNDGILILWNPATGEVIRRFDAGSTDIWSAKFSPDGGAILSNAGSGMILWDVASGDEIRRYTASSSIRSVYFGPDHTAISGGTDGIVTLWDVETGDVLNQYDSHAGLVQAVAFSGNGQMILAGTVDGSLIFWDTKTGQELHHFTDHTDTILGLAVSHDGRLAATASADHTLRVWNVTEPALLHDLVGHTNRVIAASFSSDGQKLFTASADNTMRTWAADTGQPVSSIALTGSSVTGAAMNPATQTMLVGMRDGSFSLWRLDTGARLDFWHPDSLTITSVALSTDGQMGLIGKQDGGLLLWNLATGVQVFHAAQDYGPIVSVAFSPDGRTALTGTRDHMLLLWDLEQGRYLKVFSGHGGAVYDVSYSPDGQSALSGARDGSVILWNLAGNKEHARFVGHSAAVWGVAFSPDGKTALSGSEDAVIEWDLSTGAELQHFKPEDVPFDLAFSPDGKMAAAGEVEGMISLWQTFSSLDDLISWTQQNRYVADLNCVQREIYGLTPCE